MEKFERIPIQLERGVDIEMLDGTGILAAVRVRQWECYVQHPSNANERLVREFYASIVLDDFFVSGTVVVQGWQITLTPEVVNDYFGLLNLPQASGGMKEHEYFTAWSRDLLHLETAFWHVFCDYSILPKTHWTTLTLPVASVLFSIQMAGIKRAVVRGRTLIPKQFLGRTTYKKLANQRSAPGL
ncbi:hypothetical protein ACOSQ3_027410 [Xanthoceras sorbifolium]